MVRGGKCRQVPDAEQAGQLAALSNRLLELGEVKRRSLRFLEALRPTLTRYSELTRDTIHVAILDGTDIVLIERVAGQRDGILVVVLQQVGPVGRRRRDALRLSAAGRVRFGGHPPSTRGCGLS